jgi:cobalt-precorrin-5B (C1)-methyltransferase
MGSVTEKPSDQLKRGWTTGACAAAASKAAYAAILTGQFPDPVSITLPKGETPAFPLVLEELGAGFARAGIVKDAGDDPDVTHGATVIATVRPGGSGIRFKAGEGVGVVTKAGLPVAVGEPAINPVPRSMIIAELEALALAHGVCADMEVEISIPGGAEIALKTWNPRLGIVGGLSILGTTGVVHPFSCSAWIHSIHRGIDVARANGFGHVAGSTGSMSEDAVAKLYGLPLEALIDMGDFAGGMLKYLRLHPVPRVSIAGGFAKMVKLAQGAMDLHSGRSQVDFEWLAARVPEALRARVLAANTALEVLTLCREAGFDIAALVAAAARESAVEILRGSDCAVDVVVVDRGGEIIGRG